MSLKTVNLGCHVGVDPNGGEHGEVDEEVPAGKENQGSRKGSRWETSLLSRMVEKCHNDQKNQLEFCLDGKAMVIQPSTGVQLL